MIPSMAFEVASFSSSLPLGVARPALLIPSGKPLLLVRDDRGQRGSRILSLTQTGRNVSCEAIVDNRRLPLSRMYEDFDIVQEEEGNPLPFLDKLALAWRILFPERRRRRPESNAEIAKQRLQMVLISDRCSVSDSARRKIVTNIVGAISDFLVIDSEDKVQMQVSAHPDLGTVCAIQIPVRRVRPGFQDDNDGSFPQEFSEDEEAHGREIEDDLAITDFDPWNPREN